VNGTVGGTAGGRPLTRRDDFNFAFSEGGLPFAVIAKGGPLPDPRILTELLNAGIKVVFH
jgi:hypothetical protein